MLDNRLQKDPRKNFTIRIVSIVLLSSFFIGFILGCKEARLTTSPENPTTTPPTISPPVTIGNYEYQQHEYLFTVPSDTTKVDILFIVDDSPSMSQEQSRLGAGFDSFIRQIRVSQIDYQIGFITTDMSGDGPTQNGNLLPIARNVNNGYILRSGDANQANKFRRTIERPETGSADERGIYAAITALEGNQHGIIRSDADLAIMIISDEDSRGEGGTHGRPLIRGKDYGTDLVEVATRLKGNKKVTISAIIVKPESNDNCFYEQSQQGDGADPHYGIQYQTAAEATNGVVGSICETSYNYQLEQMSYRLISTVRFIDLTNLGLECMPDQTGGRRITVEGFSEDSYNVSSQSIDFDSALMQGDEITIQYWCKVD